MLPTLLNKAKRFISVQYTLLLGILLKENPVSSILYAVPKWVETYTFRMTGLNEICFVIISLKFCTFLLIITTIKIIQITFHNNQNRRHHYLLDQTLRI